MNVKPDRKGIPEPFPGRPTAMPGDSTSSVEKMTCCRLCWGLRSTASPAAAIQVPEPPTLLGCGPNGAKRRQRRRPKSPPKRYVGLHTFSLGHFGAPLPRGALCSTRDPLPPTGSNPSPPHTCDAPPPIPRRGACRAPRPGFRTSQRCIFPKMWPTQPQKPRKELKIHSNCTPRTPYGGQNGPKRLPKTPNSDPRRPHELRATPGRPEGEQTMLWAAKSTPPVDALVVHPAHQPPPPGLPALDNLNALTSPPCSAPHADAPLPGSADLGGGGRGAGGWVLLGPMGRCSRRGYIGRLTQIRNRWRRPIQGSNRTKEPLCHGSNN